MHALTFNEDGTKEMAAKKKEALVIRKKLMEKFKTERKDKKVQLRGFERIKVGDDAPLHYKVIARQYNL